MAAEEAGDLVIPRAGLPRHSRPAQQQEDAEHVVRQALGRLHRPRPGGFIGAVRIDLARPQGRKATTKRGEVRHGGAQPADAAAHEEVAMQGAGGLEGGAGVGDHLGDDLFNRLLALLLAHLRRRRGDEGGRGRVVDPRQQLVGA